MLGLKTKPPAPTVTIWLAPHAAEGYKKRIAAKAFMISTRDKSRLPGPGEGGII